MSWGRSCRTKKFFPNEVSRRTNIMHAYICAGMHVRNVSALSMCSRVVLSWHIRHHSTRLSQGITRQLLGSRVRRVSPTLGPGASEFSTKCAGARTLHLNKGCGRRPMHVNQATSQGQFVSQASVSISLHPYLRAPCLSGHGFFMHYRTQLVV